MNSRKKSLERLVKPGARLHPDRKLTGEKREVPTVRKRKPASKILRPADEWRPSYQQP